MSPLPVQAAAPIGGRSFDLTAVVDLAAGDEGVLYATGSTGAGISIFVQRDRLVADYNAFGEHTIIESVRPLGPGRHELALRVRRLDGRAGTAELVVDGTAEGAVDLPLLMRMISSVGPSVGYDHGSPVSDRYAAPFAFTGELHEVVIQASPERFADTAAAEARAEMSRQ
jgi:arylsulfatase